MKINIDTDLILRQLEIADAEDIFRVIDTEREYLGKWLPFVEHTHVLKDTQDFVFSVTKAPRDISEYVFTIWKNNEFVGLIGTRDTDRANQKTEIGYWLSEKFQGQGIVTRSVEVLCALLFSKLGMNRIQIKCATGNAPSKKIPQRLGFTFEGIERQGELLSNNEFTDLEVYSKLKNDPRRNDNE